MTKEETGGRGEMDRRIIERKLLRGQISEKELKKYLSKLPDISDNAEEVLIEMEQGPPGPEP
jgi:hypothetical protein